LFSISIQLGFRGAGQLVLPVPIMLGDVTVTFNGVRLRSCTSSRLRLTAGSGGDHSGQAIIVVNREGLAGGEARPNVAANRSGPLPVSPTWVAILPIALNQGLVINLTKICRAPGEIMSFFMTGAGAVSPLFRVARRACSIHSYVVALGSPRRLGTRRLKCFSPDSRRASLGWFR